MVDNFDVQYEVLLSGVMRKILHYEVTSNVQD